MDTSTAPRRPTSTGVPPRPTATDVPRTPTAADRPRARTVAARTRRQRRLGAVALLVGLSTATVALLLAVEQLTW